MKALVTGASGFLGTWLCKTLDKKGWNIHALVRPQSGREHLKPLSNLQFKEGDITNFDSLVTASKGMDFIFHLAGLVAHSEKYRSMMRKVNVQGTSHVIEVCRQSKLKLIYMSSVVAIGASSKPEILNEDSLYNMEKHNIGYFDTKKQAELLVQTACKKGQISAVILNPSTVYGAGDMKKGSRKIQIKVAQGRFPFYTSGGVSVVDVQSVVNACLSAVTKGRNGERYILSGDNISIKKLFSLIAKATGKKPPFIHLNKYLLRFLGTMGTRFEKLGIDFPVSRESVDIASFYHWFDHSKASSELDFAPANAEQAIKNSIEWWIQHHK